MQRNFFEEENDKHKTTKKNTKNKERKEKWEKNWCEPGNRKENFSLWLGKAAAVGDRRPEKDQKTGH